MLTGRIVRAARALADWSQWDLSNASGVSIASIRRFESPGSHVRPTRTTKLRLKQAFETAGISFVITQGFVQIQSRGKQPIDC